MKKAKKKIGNHKMRLKGNFGFTMNFRDLWNFEVKNNLWDRKRGIQSAQRFEDFEVLFMAAFR